MNGYNFTEQVRKCLALARGEAVRLGHEYVGTEHILLAVISEGENIAVTVMENLGIGLSDVQYLVESTVKRGTRKEPMPPDLPYTSRAKKVLDLSIEEARSLN